MQNDFELQYTINGQPNKPSKERKIDEYIFQEQGVALITDRLHFSQADGESHLTVGAVAQLSVLQQQSLDLRNELILLILGVSLMLALLTYFIAKYLTRPIKKLTRVAGQVAAGKDDVHIPISGNDEVSQLGKAFRLMLNKLTHSQQALRTLNQSLESEVQQQTKALEEKNIHLEEAVVRSEQAAVAKSMFLATMSHEIRTPLNGILGLTELLLDSKLTLQQYENMSTVHTCGETLLTILNDILDFSKMEAGQFDLSHHDFNPNHIVEHVSKLYTTQTSEKNIELVAEGIPDLHHMLLGDSDRLQQIMMNLVHQPAQSVGISDTEMFRHKAELAGNGCSHWQKL